MISDILTLYNFVNGELEKASVLNTLFNWKGERVKGNKEIEINIIPTKNRKDVWFYCVKPYKDFVFVPYPVNPSVHFDFGRINQEKNSDANYFRFVPNPMSIYGGGESNVKVDFMVFGYIPNDLMDKIGKK